MKLRLNEDWGIKTDRYNYIVCKIKEVKREEKVKEEWQGELYCNSLTHALENYVDLRLKVEDNIETIEEVVELHNNLMEKLDNVLKQLDKRLVLKRVEEE